MSERPQIPIFTHFIRHSFEQLCENLMVHMIRSVCGILFESEELILPIEHFEATLPWLKDHNVIAKIVEI